MATYDPILTSKAGVPLRKFISIDWTGDAAAALISAVKRMQNYEPLLRTIGRKIVGSVRMNIMEQRTPEGSRWQPLKHPRARGHNPGSVALFDTGAMYDDVNYAIDLPDSVEVGTDSSIPYAKYHQLGTRWIPARRFIGVRDGDLPDLVHDHVARAWGG